MKDVARYTSIKDFDIQQGEGVHVSLWMQGCVHRCGNCHNPDTWDLSDKSGKVFTETEVNKIVDILNCRIKKNLSILGGEPLIPRNYEMLELLVEKAKKRNPNIKIWLWTGFNFEDVKHINLMQYIDVLVDGKYIHELREVTRYKGSSNQRVIDVKKSLDKNKVILYK